jgi:signal transduction histidine kinase
LSFEVIQVKMATMQPTLRRRMVLYLALMVSGSLLMGLAAIVGVVGVHDNLNSALQGNQQLRQVYEIGLNVATARRALATAHPDQTAALTAMETALAKLDASDYGAPGTPLGWLDPSKKAECQSRLREAVSQLKRDAGGDASVREAQSSAINGVLGQLANLSSDVRATIGAEQRAAEQKLHCTLLIIIALLCVVVLAAVAIGVRQYRSVMRPLNGIGRAVRKFANGRLDERIAATGDREFVSLANDFNSMAAELEGLYRQLEEKVAAKSKELVRSERLASVGYLAAGVAHEMNNPLGIIAGYGERSLQHLERGLSSTTLSSAQRAIKIMCEEAFRCKEITARLLSLARPGDRDRIPVSISAMIEQVISHLGVVAEYKDRHITVETPARTDLRVMAREGEIRQVVLNLMVNALQATTPGTGEVHVLVKAIEQEIEFSVRDNGSGMTAHTLERVFEPFFTEKRGKQRPGTGLGLSITHAIVLDHGGRITAESGGLGKGSRFIVRLPAATEGVQLADVA